MTTKSSSARQFGISEHGLTFTPSCFCKQGGLLYKDTDPTAIGIQSALAGQSPSDQPFLMVERFREPRLLTRLWDNPGPNHEHDFTRSLNSASEILDRKPDIYRNLPNLQDLTGNRQMDILVSSLLELRHPHRYRAVRPETAAAFLSQSPAQMPDDLRDELDAYLAKNQPAGDAETQPTKVASKKRKRSEKKASPLAAFGKQFGGLLGRHAGIGAPTPQPLGRSTPGASQPQPLSAPSAGQAQPAAAPGIGRDYFGRRMVATRKVPAGPSLQNQTSAPAGARPQAQHAMPAAQTKVPSWAKSLNSVMSSPVHPMGATTSGINALLGKSSEDKEAMDPALQLTLIGGAAGAGAGALSGALAKKDRKKKMLTRGLAGGAVGAGGAAAASYGLPYIHKLIEQLRGRSEMAGAQARATGWLEGISNATGRALNVDDMTRKGQEAWSRLRANLPKIQAP